jgi:5-methylcytosine-specific restriction endonuclease McrA
MVVRICTVCGRRCEVPGARRCSRHVIALRGAEAKRAQRITYATQTTCWICGQTVAAGEARVADHIIPCSPGGADDPTNMRLAHAACHDRRHRGG